MSSLPASDVAYVAGRPPVKATPLRARNQRLSSAELCCGRMADAALESQRATRQAPGRRRPRTENGYSGVWSRHRTAESPRVAGARVIEPITVTTLHEAVTKTSLNGQTTTTSA